MSCNSMGTSKKVFMAHNACLNASYDFNLLKEGLKRRGYKLVDKPEDADEVIFSGCAVREIWVDDAIHQINAIHDRAPHVQVTVTGCVANVSSDRVKRLSRPEGLKFGSHEEILKTYTGLELDRLDRDFPQDTSINYEDAPASNLKQLRRRVGPQKTQIVAALQEIDREHNTELESLYRRVTKGFVFYKEIEPVEFITVTRSCPYKCSFCAIPRGRGAYKSVPLGAILQKAQGSLARGIRRLTLVGDEVGNYGAGSPGPRFHDLVTALLDLDPKIRLSIRYIEPKPFMRNADLFRRLCGDGRIDLLYVSLQSGSQRVLNAMNRRYDIEKVARLCCSLRRSTDTIFYSNWMVGFPGESHEDYRETVNLVRELDLHINIAIPFSPRPNTPANDLRNQLSDSEKEERLRGLSRVIANMKVAYFSPQLDFLKPARRQWLLQKIGEAEMVQYDNGPPGPTDTA